MLEPLKGNVGLIRQTIKENGLGPDVELVSSAVSDKSGKAVLHVDLLGGATSSIEDQKTFQENYFGVSSGTQDVSLVAIDDERSRREYPVDLMKIDVEGHEESVIRGALGTIERDQPVIFIECHQRRRPFADLIRLGYNFVDANRLVKAPLFADETMLFFCFPPRFSNRVDDLLDNARRSGPWA
jgi:FkbM family methyltransferase